MLNLKIHLKQNWTAWLIMGLNRHLTSILSQMHNTALHTCINWWAPFMTLSFLYALSTSLLLTCCSKLLIRSAASRSPPQNNRSLARFWKRTSWPPPKQIGKNETKNWREKCAVCSTHGDSSHLDLVLRFPPSSTSIPQMPYFASPPTPHGSRIASGGC